MSLLQEIQSDATGTEVPVEVVLRKCLMLATRLGHDALKDWVRNELDGYADGAALPPYRSNYPIQLLGNFANAAWHAERQVVPLSALPEGMQDLRMSMDFRESISAIRDLMEKTGNTLSMAAPPGLNAHIRLYDRMQCTNLWFETASTTLTTILDQVRNRVLAFSLEIELENPAAGESITAEDQDPPVPPEKVTQIYNTTILGGINAVASGGSSASVNAELQFAPGDVDGLVRWLLDIGMTEEDADGLRDAIDEDVDGDDGIGPRVAEWLGRMGVKIATGATRFSASTGSQLLAMALAKHYGII